jgi:hypothetical protein
MFPLGQQSQETVCVGKELRCWDGQVVGGITLPARSRFADAQAAHFVEERGTRNRETRCRAGDDTMTFAQNAQYMGALGNP